MWNFLSFVVSQCIGILFALVIDVHCEVWHVGVFCFFPSMLQFQFPRLFFLTDLGLGSFFGSSQQEFKHDV